MINKLNLNPTFAAGELLESCFAVGDHWRLRTIDYIRQNYLMLKDEIKRRGIKINVYKMESAFICLLDFASYKWPHSQIRKRL
jgi:bifunctional pyridoxal-dependent enzyme with beta-cystathionase and maltose regulon repressor activities